MTREERSSMHCNLSYEPYPDPLAQFIAVCLSNASSMHVTGEQLGQLTGIAAVLRFPLPEIEEDGEDSSDEVCP